jgi:integrase
MAQSLVNWPYGMAIRVEHGKRHKDRYPLLSHDLLLDLRAYWRRHRCIPWLFPNAQRTGPISGRVYLRCG